MKVLHLIGGGDVGGAKIHVLSLAKELGKYINVKIISLRPGEFADDARKMGIDIDVVKTGNIFKDISIVLKKIREEGYDIIHSHGAKGNMFALILKHLTHLPTVTTVHSDYRLDYLFSFWKRYSYGLINTIALRFVDYYVTVSKRFKDMLIERNFNFRNIYTVYNGMDFSKYVKTYPADEFRKKYNLNINENNVIVGILARLDPVKGVSTFINAAKKVVENNPNIIFLIGGDGDERKKLERQVKRLGLEDHVFFLGWITDSYEFLSNIDINVLSSLSETFPYSILEGVRVKRATIATNVGGIPDLIENGVNGYLFNPGDADQLAEYILELAGNKEKREAMSEKLFEKASTQFSLDNMCRTQLNIYRSIAQRSGSKVREEERYDAIISGYYGFKNIGDDAMLLAIIEDLKKYREDIKLAILSNDPVEIKKEFGINSINRLNVFKIIKAMKRSKLFIYGGGTLIQESTSTRSLFYYLLIIWLAQKLGLKVMLYANGIDPIKKFVNRRITQRIMNRVHLITLREEASFIELEKLQITKPKIVVTADPAFNIKLPDSAVIDRIFRSEGIPDSGLYIGFSARKWDGFKKNEEANAVKTIAALGDYLVEKYSIVPVFIPMQPNDLLILDEIASHMKNKSYVIRGRYSVPEVLGITRRMSMVVGMRLHSLIFAASLCIPAVGLVYEPKVEAFLSYIGQKNASAGCVRHLEFESLKNTVETIWNNRESISGRMPERINILKLKALENAKLASALIEED